MSKSNNYFKLDLNVEIKKHTPTTEEIQDYIQAQHKALKENSNLTLNNYIKETFYKDSNTIIVADLSNRIFKKEDFSAGDFSGSIVKNTSFIDCDLTDSVFCDVDLNNAYFSDTKLVNIDFRGAALENCKFDEYSHEAGGASQTEGIKFSTTSSLGRIYADIKSDMTRAIERQDLKAQKELELEKASNGLSYIEKVLLTLNLDTGNEKYNRAKENITLMTGGKIFPEKNYVMHPTFQKVFSSSSCIFDPAYVRGSSKAERDRETQYVPLTKEDVIDYLVAIKTEKGLSLNDFAARLPNTIVYKEGARIIADCSSKVEVSSNNIWVDRIDLSNIDFTGANLKGAVFAGSLLKNCKFIDTNISKASFEGAVLDRTVFSNVNARNANFFNTNLSQSDIKDSKFQHAYMACSKAEDITIDSSNFDYANIKEGKWNHAQLANSTLNYANLEGISLISASLQKISIQCAMLNKAILNECSVIESDFSTSLMKDVLATRATFNDTLLNDIKASGINLTESELSGFTQLKGADLQNAILEKVKATQINFTKANLDKVNAKFANFTGANFEEVKARFADLDNAVLDKAQASGIDMTGAKLNQASARGADFTKAIMENIEAQKADLTGAILEEANLRSANMTAAILAKVNMEKAEIDAATSFTKANITEATGNLKEIDSQGEIINEKKSVKEHTKQSNEIDKEKNNSWFQKGVAGKITGGIAKTVANTVDLFRATGQQVSNLMEAEIGSKWGRIIGAVAGVMAGIAVAASIVTVTVITGGIGLATTAGIYAGCALAAGAAGTGVGHVIGKNIGVGTIIAAGASITAGINPLLGIGGGIALDAGLKKLTGKNLGQHMNSAGLITGVLVAAGSGGLGLPALLAGAGSGKAIDLAVEKLTGKTIGQLGNKALETVSSRLNEISENYNIDPKAKEWIKEQTKCQEISNVKLYNLKQSIYIVQIIDQSQTYSLINNTQHTIGKVESLDQILKKAKEEQQADNIVEEGHNKTILNSLGKADNKKFHDIVKEKFLTKHTDLNNVDKLFQKTNKEISNQINS